MTAGPRWTGGRYFVQNPGPTNIPDRVLEAFRRPAVDFADPDFIALADSVWDELPEIFGGADKIVLLTAVGHGAWESTLTNTLEPGDAVLIPDCGLFGRRWARMARDLGYEVVMTEPHIRRPTDPAEIADILAADTAHRIGSVCIVHSETSSGAVTDLAAMRAAIDAADHPALYVVDGVCSLGIEPLRMRDWGIDVVVAASQKGLMMPPGLSFCGLSERAVERNRSVATPRFHLAWEPRFEEGPIYNRFGGTPPIQHMFALRTALDMIAETGGIDASIARHRRWAAAVHAAVDGWGSGGPWEINIAEPKHRTAAITCVRTGEIAAGPLISMARDRFRVSVGSGMMTEMEGRAFRIGHLGDLNEPMLLGALGGLETAMAVLGLPHGHGLPAAVASLASTAAQSAGGSGASL